MILTPFPIHYYVFRLPSLHSVSPLYFQTAMIGSICSRKYNCPEYYIFFRKDYILPSELMSRSGERFFIFDSCKDLRPSWICFTGYFLINQVENIEEYEKRVLGNFTISYVSIRPYSREESRALGNFMYKEWRKNNYDKILDI